MEKKTAEIIIYKDFLSYKTTYKTDKNEPKTICNINPIPLNENSNLVPKHINGSNYFKTSVKSLIDAANKMKECANRLDKITKSYKLISPE